MATWGFRNGMDHGWLRAVIDSASEGVLVEANARVMYANRRYAQLLGYQAADDLVGRPIEELIAERDVARLVEFGRMRLQGRLTPPTAYDFAARRKDGSETRLHASVSVEVVSAGRCITTFVRPFYPEESSPQSPRAQVDGPHQQLSVRERQVMDLILNGTRIKEIAVRLVVSEQTVATHRSRLLAKIGLSDNRGLFQYALRHGLVHWP